MNTFQNYQERTHEQLVKDLNAAHDRLRDLRRTCDEETLALHRQLRWAKRTIHILSGLIVAALASTFVQWLRILLQ
jgi:hypothetical protein